jgi:hypothetical protein
MGLLQIKAAIRKDLMMNKANNQWSRNSSLLSDTTTSAKQLSLGAPEMESETDTCKNAD